jgi:hypothetical protein
MCEKSPKSIILAQIRGILIITAKCIGIEEQYILGA